jgi:hypothetical protein
MSSPEITVPREMVEFIAGVLNAPDKAESHWKALHILTETQTHWHTLHILTGKQFEVCDD